MMMCTVGPCSIEMQSAEIKIKYCSTMKGTFMFLFLRNPVIFECTETLMKHLSGINTFLNEGKPSHAFGSRRSK